jgi:hypothetical protein
MLLLGCPHLMLLSLSRVDTKGFVGKDRYSGTQEGELLRSPTNMGFTGFLHISLHLENASIIATMTLPASSK